MYTVYSNNRMIANFDNAEEAATLVWSGIGDQIRFGDSAVVWTNTDGMADGMADDMVRRIYSNVSWL